MKKENVFYPINQLWCAHRIEITATGMADVRAEKIIAQDMIDLLFEDQKFQDYLSKREDFAVQGDGSASVQVLDKMSGLVMSGTVEVEQYHDKDEGDAFVLTIFGIGSPVEVQLKDEYVDAPIV